MLTTPCPHKRSKMPPQLLLTGATKNEIKDATVVLWTMPLLTSKATVVSAKKGITHTLLLTVPAKPPVFQLLL